MGTILVVEDDPKLRFIIDSQLYSAGFEVVTEEGGDGALTTLETLTPDLVLLNILLLPGIDGIEVCRRIRADERLAHIPVIFLTGRANSESRAQCLSAGANDYVTKPWNSSDLILRINRAIALARGER
ncbi:MAG TPA: response regulator [Candidatus Binatia bacterium]|nr:response regulator [Candidatus Binatia bacterium]